MRFFPAHWDVQDKSFKQIRADPTWPDIMQVQVSMKNSVTAPQICKLSSARRDPQLNGMLVKVDAVWLFFQFVLKQALIYFDLQRATKNLGNLTSFWKGSPALKYNWDILTASASHHYPSQELDSRGHIYLAVLQIRLHLLIAWRILSPFVPECNWNYASNPCGNLALDLRTTFPVKLKPLSTYVLDWEN